MISNWVNVFLFLHLLFLHYFMASHEFFKAMYQEYFYMLMIVFLQFIFLYKA